MLEEKVIIKERQMKLHFKEKAELKVQRELFCRILI